MLFKDDEIKKECTITTGIRHAQDSADTKQHDKTRLGGQKKERNSFSSSRWWFEQTNILDEAFSIDRLGFDSAGHTGKGRSVIAWVHGSIRGW
mmetsp:Transcript_39098/g.81771  ORF Transcript_39098/g.81771 Transcript_39098/m.81771 type:complete len:93 (+) Transcript_39098:95-373(+)